MKSDLPWPRRILGTFHKHIMGAHRFAMDRHVGLPIASMMIDRPLSSSVSAFLVSCGPSNASHPPNSSLVPRSTLWRERLSPEVVRSIASLPPSSNPAKRVCHSGLQSAMLRASQTLSQTSSEREESPKSNTMTSSNATPMGTTVTLYNNATKTWISR